MIPGEMFIKDGEIELNAGRKTATLSVTREWRLIRSTRGRSGTGWAVAMVTFSARPQAGVIASAVNPWGAKWVVKASIVCARTGSAALIAIRQLDRWSPTNSSSAMRPAHSA